jgi:oligoendopeptidase F
MDRSQVSNSDKWNVESLYLSLEDWKKEFAKHAGEPRWPELAVFRGRLHEGAKTIAQMLEVYFNLEQHLSKLYTYAHLRHDEDVGNDSHKQAYQLIATLLNDFRQESCWIEPELLQLNSLDLNAKELEPYRFYIQKILRQKPHTLRADQEEILAAAGLALDSSSRAFSAFNNADLRFPPVEDAQGKLQPLTHAKYLAYLRSFDRTLRKNAFQALHTSYLSWENTLCELIHGEVQTHLFNARTRKFPSCLAAALFSHNIDPKVYMNLIAAVRQNLPALHRYMGLRKKVLKVDELHLYDLHVPLVSDAEIKMEYEPAARMIVDSVAPLGTTYQSILEKGFFQDRWVDRYENLRKRSGAYSSGCFGGMPYILMNYQGNYNDIKTLAHEAGHSMHSFFSWKTQPYQVASYPIFVAEVASTFNEELLHRHLMKTIEDSKTKAYLINQKIEDIRNTFFRQVMFAEFELKIHQFVEQGIPLTPSQLKTEYHQLNVDYFGPSVVIDEAIDIEWARIPHFYYNFYVYQYATGISAASALIDLVSKDGSEKYLQFLSSGGSRYPLELLQTAGVDMYTPSAVEATIAHFSHLTDELQRIILP